MSELLNVISGAIAKPHQRAVGVRLTLDAALHIIDESGSCDRLRLAEKAGCHRETAARAIKALHAGQKIHVTGWNRSERGPYYPIFSTGAGKDAAKPARIMESAKSAKYRNSSKGRSAAAKRREAMKERAKIDPDFCDTLKIRSKKSSERRRLRTNPPHDNIFDALTGRSLLLKS